MFVKLLIYIVIGVLIYRLVKGLMVGNTGGGRRMSGRTPEQVDDVMIKDPVCGAYFPKRMGVTLDDNGHMVHFCSEKCRERYQQKQ
jgi:uncharacterized protein